LLIPWVQMSSRLGCTLPVVDCDDRRAIGRTGGWEYPSHWLTIANSADVNEISFGKPLGEDCFAVHRVSS